MARSGQRIGRRIHRAEHVEIDETVVERGDQGIGDRMRQPHQVAVDARRIDHNEVVTVLDRGYRFGESGKLRRFILIGADALRARHAKMRRSVQFKPAAPRPIPAIVDVMGETLLPGIKIYRGNPLARLQQRDRDMDGGRRLARPAFLIADNDNVGGFARPCIRLDQHDASPASCHP